MRPLRFSCYQHLCLILTSQEKSIATAAWRASIATVTIANAKVDMDQKDMDTAIRIN